MYRSARLLERPGMLRMSELTSSSACTADLPQFALMFQPAVR
jgi:hypothetical protein